MKFALIVELVQLEFMNAIVVKQPNLGHHWMVAMAFPVVEFSRQGYKIRKVLG